MFTDTPIRPARRRLFAALPGFLLAAALAGCGAAEDPSSGDSPADAQGAFPVTVEHKYGATEIPSAPQRVVTLGLSDQDAVLALGVKPVGAIDWFGERPYGQWAWIEDRWGATPPEIVGERDEYDMEKIAKLNPDLIIAQYSGMRQEQYDTLSQRWPVVAQPKGHDSYQAPWQEMTRAIGKALGKVDEAEQLITEIDQRFARVREAHPEWEGRTVAVGEPYEPGKFSAFSPNDPKMVFFKEMGFTVSAEYEKAVGTQNVADFSFERFDLVDVDRLVWLVGTPEVEQQLTTDPLYQKLAVSRENRDLFLPYQDPDIGSALSFNTVLSIPYAVDKVVPMLEAVT
ncbi:iron-siderophore ABC transporter substrate-binding protein [Amycolatopsis cihanbeyliensis]|uniref:Iron complex transport system substrate-binding protein n=1 Tax=Amycolatopsis cihanbeyliensis TaxID=1128664 RepID=A0A542DCT8_AMYCI|nr:iron-siderophore ABC transporter substrate-binding protein [Amycolatopsis cihanbeyliensis]TQJ00882.1 iron complex transport system substrate-binding protein [Amycolatopsis cihanbeyliensis]